MDLHTKLSRRRERERERERTRGGERFCEINVQLTCKSPVLKTFLIEGGLDWASENSDSGIEFCTDDTKNGRKGALLCCGSGGLNCSSDWLLRLRWNREDGRNSANAFWPKRGTDQRGELSADSWLENAGSAETAAFVQGTTSVQLSCSEYAAMAGAQRLPSAADGTGIGSEGSFAGDGGIASRGSGRPA